MEPGPDHVHLRAQALSGVQLCNPMDCNLPGSSVHGISQARILEGRGLPFPPPGDLSNPGVKAVSPVLGDEFYTTEPPGALTSDF